jgi:hypothetical protein
MNDCIKDNKVDVARLREMYPNPTAKPERQAPPDPKVYTVDEAFMWLSGNRARGTQPLFAAALVDHNPRLLRRNNEGVQLNQQYAVEIMMANDNGDFDKAWRLLDTAINFPPAVLGPDMRPLLSDENVLLATAEMLVGQVMYTIGAKEEDRAGIVSDLLVALSSFIELEGYQLAKLLESEFAYKPDTRLVIALNSAKSCNHVALGKIVATWVAYNMIKPKFKTNDRVLATVRAQNGHAVMGPLAATITWINARLAQYWIVFDDPTIDDRDNYTVNYEDVEELPHETASGAVPRPAVEEQNDAVA